MLTRLALVVAALGGAVFQSWAAPLIVAHRGASFDAPENTLAAFRLAWDQGADAIEGDFYLTADHRIVCIHDATTKRVAGTNLTVASSTLEQLRALEVGAWKGPRWKGERIPTIEEVLAVVPPGKKIFLELKSGPPIVPVVKAALAGSSLKPDQTVIISFDSKTIAEVKSHIPAVKAYWITAYKKTNVPGEWKPSPTQVLETLQACAADGLDCEAHERVDATLMNAMLDRNLSLHVWTVDKPETAARCWKLGVESITTNRPEWLRRETQRLLGL